MYHFWCFERFYQAPYIFRGIFNLWQRGHYLEATILVRHLMEAFVQIRYFLERKGELKAHLIRTPSQSRIQFRTMFEAISPGSYQAYKTLSALAHPGVGPGLFMFDYSSDEPGTLASVRERMGCEFDVEYSSYVMNQVLKLIYGFLAYVPRCFGSYTSRVDSDTERRRLEALAGLDDWGKRQTHKHPHTRAFHEFMDKIVK
jgi:hypothetical protein